MAQNLNKFIGQMYENPDLKDALKGGSEPEKKDIKSEEISIVSYTGSRFGRFTKKIGEYCQNHSADIKYLLLAIPIIAIFLFAWKAQEIQSMLAGAAAHQAVLFFKTNPMTFPPEQTAEIWINADSPLGFSAIELNFNPALVKLTSEITTYNLNRKINISTMSAANSNGKVSIVLGLDPSQKASPPSGPFEIASFKINAAASGNASSSFAFNPSISQLVSMDTVAFNVTATDLKLNLNPTPVPTATPVPRSSPIATATPIVTATPTVKPTTAPTASPAPTQTPIFTSTPIVTATPAPIANTLLSGVVYDASSNKFLSGASVKIQKAGDSWWKYKTIKTDSYGHYGVYLTQGSYNVTASKSGYKTLTQTINLRADTILNFALSKSRYYFFSFFSWHF